MTADPAGSPPPPPVRQPARVPFWRRISLIWAVPLVALAITLAIAWNAYSDRGTLIRITFADAAGITAGQTRLRFREVNVGTVETTSFSPDLSSVVVGVRVDNDIARYIDADARFWLVRPEVSAQGISRLDTVISGAFIEGFWDSAIGGAAQADFTGLQRPPRDLVRGAGTLVTLRVADAAGLSEGIPVLYRGMQVGIVQNLRLAPAGDGVLADAVIDAPHDQRLTSATVFWDTSGFAFSVGPQGLRLDVRSIAALLRGGVEFTTPISGGAAVAEGQTFRLYGTETEARDSLFNVTEGIETAIAVYLDGSVRGLAQGAPVQFQGLPVGEVSTLSVAIVRGPDGREVPMQRAILNISATRMGLPPATTEAELFDFLALGAERGLRARVASIGLLGTTLVVELLTLPDAAPQTFDRSAAPPIFPTAPPAIGNASITAEGLFARLSALPIEDVLTAATTFLNNASALVSSPELRETPGAVRSLIEEARMLIGSDAVQGVPQSVAEVLAEVRGLTADLRAAGIDEKLAAALERASEAAGAVDTAVAGVPELVTSIQQVAEQAAAIRFNELGERAGALIAELETMLRLDDTRALPAALNETLAQLAGLLQTLREGGAVEALNATMASAQAAADGVARASADLPALTARIDGVVRSLDAMIATYGERSTFNAETLSVLRELRRTTAAVGSLAQTIERNPRALLTGR